MTCQVCWDITERGQVRLYWASWAHIKLNSYIKFIVNASAMLDSKYEKSDVIGYWLGTHIHICFWGSLINCISLTVLTHTDLGTLPAILLSFAPLWQVCVAEGLYRMLFSLSPSCPISSCTMGWTSDKRRLLESARQVVHPGREALQRCTNVCCSCCA